MMHHKMPGLPAARSLELSKEPSDEEGINGHRLVLTEDEADKMNFTVLVATNERPTRFIIPAEQPLGLLFFRQMFTRLRLQQVEISDTMKVGAGRTEDLSADELDEFIPIAAFQRAMGRLFFMLRDPVGFDATVYDNNHNDCVGWGEFTQVWKDRQISVRLSLAERIYITFDDPQSSHLAKIVSAATLLTIVVSSFSFILSTVPELQEDKLDGSAPYPGPAFDLIEYVCLTIFMLEYLARFCTAPLVRNEICDRDVILEIATGYEKITLSTPFGRTWRFLLNPSNIIDLAAILPGAATVLMLLITKESAGNGGGFVVLRLVRLTRIVRAFRIGKYVDAVVVVKQTMITSTKALYVLAFILLLGVVIFGSLIYLLEQGTWNVETQRYFRPTMDRLWNETLQEFVIEDGPSPWKSIPHSFWWAIVTAAGVGYGEHSPTTPSGQVVAAICMVWSLVILALPVGVIGGTFTVCWHDFAKNKIKEAAALRREMIYVTSAVQRMEPAKVSRLVLLEVWGDDEGADRYSLPANPEGYMGEVKLELELSQDRPISHDLKLHLCANAQVCDRKVTGSIFIRYDWTPAPDPNPRTADAELLLSGTLKFYISGGTGLLNTDWSHHSVRSSPYVLMKCYPHSPKPTEHLKPVVWRSRVERHNLNPCWDCSENFHYLWYNHGHNIEEIARELSFTHKFLPKAASKGCRRGSREGGSPVSRTQSTVSTESSSPELSRYNTLSGSKVLSGNNLVRMAPALSQLTSEIPGVTAGIMNLQEQMEILTRRVDCMQRAADHDIAEQNRATGSSQARLSGNDCGAD